MGRHLICRLDWYPSVMIANNLETEVYGGSVRAQNHCPLHYFYLYSIPFLDYQKHKIKYHNFFRAYNNPVFGWNGPSGNPTGACLYHCVKGKQKTLAQIPNMLLIVSISGMYRYRYSIALSPSPGNYNVRCWLAWWMEDVQRGRHKRACTLRGP